MQSVRVFVSSTFLDMHAERDHLNRIVFPELRSRFAQRGADFVGIDLRWGLTEAETQRLGALEACRAEIDRCRPFFVSLLGDRYGWVPPPEWIPRGLMDEARRDVSTADAALLGHYTLDETLAEPVYRLRRDGELSRDVAARLAAFWQQAGFDEAGRSITEQEILHGARNAKGHDGHAFFYLRRLQLSSAPPFPEQLLPLFVEQDGRRRQRLDDLKQRIDAAQRATLLVRTYDAQYDGLRVDPLQLPSLVARDELPFLRHALRDGVLQADELQQLTEESQACLHASAGIALRGIEEFGRQVLEDVWSAIDGHLERGVAVVDTHVDERSHERFVGRATRTFIGRDELIDRILAYIDGSDERLPLIVTGASGVGKSTLIAECVRRCRRKTPEALVVPLFIGAAPGSTDLATALRFLCGTLRREASIEEDVAADPDILQIQLQRFLAIAAAARPVILFIDAVNQLDAAHRSHELNWLPFYLPRDARLIVSTLEGDCLEAIRRRLPVERELTVPSLPQPDRMALVGKQLAVRAKRLTDEQLERLVDDRRRTDAGLPLYLLIAVEELSLARDRQALDARLAHLPETVPELFVQVLQRLEHDHTAPATERALRLIAVSRSGLLESEIIDILAASGDFSPVRWTQLYRALEFYLRPRDETSRSGMIDFYHDQLRIAVFRRYLEMDSPASPQSEAGRAAHDELARYFRSTAAAGDGDSRWRVDRPHCLSELPYHLVNAGMPAEARALLLDFDWLQAKLETLDAAALLADFALFQGDEVLQAVEGSIRKAASTLAKDKSQFAGQLLGRLLSYSAPEIRTLLARAAAWQGPHWLRPLTPSLARPDMPRTSSFIGVLSVALTADLRHAISCSNDGVVTVWDLETEQEIRSLGTYSLIPCAAVATPYGDRVITSSADGALTVWAPFDRAEPLHVFRGHTAAITALAITADGRHAISASEDQSLKLWDVQGGFELFRFGGQLVAAHRLAITPDARRALSASFDGSIRFWDVEQGSELRPPLEHGRPIKALAISTDGSRAVFSSDEAVRVLDIDRGTEIDLPGHHGVIRTLASTANGVVVSGSDDINLRVWDVNQCCQLAILEEHWWSVTAASVTPDGRYAVSTSRDETIKVWDLQTHKDLKTLRAPSQWINSVATTPDGRHVLTASRDRTIKVWDAESGVLVRALSGHTEWANTVVVTPDGGRALSGADDFTVRVWDLSSGSTIATLGGFANGISALAVSPDGRRAVSGCWDSTLKIWDLDTCSEIRQLPGHLNDQRTGWIRSVAITPDGRRIISAAQDGLLKIWDLETGEELRALTGHDGWVMGVAVFPDGRRAISSSADGTLKTWDLESGEVLQTMRGHQAFVTSVALLPGARFAASTSEDGTLRVWELATGRSVMSFTGDGELRTCAVSPDGRTIVAGEDSGRLHLLRWTASNDVEAASRFLATTSDGAT